MIAFSPKLTSFVASQSIPKEGIRPHKGRPKFPMFTEQQINRGPHKLSKEYEVPAPINKHLRDYQRDGVDFLFHQFTEGKGGSG